MSEKTVLTTEKIIELVQSARKTMHKAYAPYSKFKVGAAVLGSDGRIYTGCNVENVSYGLTNCAERTAIFKAVSEGIKNFLAVAIIADTEDYCSPCGACRQVIAEFGTDIQVIQANNLGQYKISAINELLPGCFSAEDLERGH